MTQSQWTDYADSLVGLTDAELVERIASHLEQARRYRGLASSRHLYDDEWDRLSCCEQQARDRLKPGLFLEGRDLANRRRDEARAAQG